MLGRSFHISYFIFHQSYIILHISSIIYDHISYYITYIIIYHQLSSYIISSYIVMYHHISSYIVMYHHISSYIIIYIFHHISCIIYHISFVILLAEYLIALHYIVHQGYMINYHCRCLMSTAWSLWYIIFRFLYFHLLPYILDLIDATLLRWQMLPLWVMKDSDRHREWQW